MYRSISSDKMFELKERAKKLCKESHYVAYAMLKCAWCYGRGWVSAVTFSVRDGEPIKTPISPVDPLPCVCTGEWPYYGQGEDPVPTLSEMFEKMAEDKDGS